MYITDPHIIKHAQLVPHLPCGTPFLQDRWDKLQDLVKIDPYNLSQIDAINLLEERIRCGDFKLYVQIVSDGQFLFSHVHDVIAAYFQDLLFLRNSKSLLSLAPRHGKSMLMCYLTTYCYALNDGYQEGLYGTYGKSLTVDFGTMIRDVMMREKYLQLFPSAELHSQSRGAMAFRTKIGGKFNGVGVGTSTTGKGAGPGMREDLFPGPLIIDDPVKDMKDALSEKVMTSTHQWWSSEASTRGNKLHFKLITATRYSLNDLHAFLLGEQDPYTLEYANIYDEKENPDGWRYLNIPAVCINEANDPLHRKLGEAAWPDMFNEEYLRITKRDKGVFTFSALYMGNPIPEEGGLFNENYLSWCELDEVPKLSTIFVSLDPAFGVMQDESVFTVCGVSRNTDELYILNQFGDNSWEFPELIEKSEFIQKMYNADFFVVESTASGKPLIQHFKKQGTIKMKGYPEKGTPLRDKQQKVSQVLPVFKNDKVVCVRDASWNHKLFQQVRQFPFGAHDDRLDSMCIGVEYWIVNYRKNSVEEMNIPRGKSKRVNVNDLLDEFQKVSAPSRRYHDSDVDLNDATPTFDW